ncbi:hypothetical protein [Halomonas hibernica]|uniref:hypothetical protein n=1 Tax=Halomonas hibernica TaxID=2591147 RepID=UPI0015537878|nr:hypothetical protein [Halomonas hibernica]
MSNEKYSLVQYKETQEYHLYESRSNPDGSCNLKGKTPLCQSKSVTPENSGLFVCQNENDTRIKCAEYANKGKDICGVCVSAMYATED